MELNKVEIQLMYAAMMSLREGAEDFISELSLSDPCYNDAVDKLKSCNELLRRLRHFMKKHGTIPISMRLEY